ncbi:MAG: YlbE-like family protein [bacterium]|nr:YlbE-like family protein [bacterium]
MIYTIKEKLLEDEKYLQFLRENSNWYKILNRDKNEYNNFLKEMKIKYKLRTIDKVDNIIDSVDLITKIISASGE